MAYHLTHQFYVPRRSDEPRRRREPREEPSVVIRRGIALFVQQLERGSSDFSEVPLMEVVLYRSGKQEDALVPTCRIRFHSPGSRANHKKDFERALQIRNGLFAGVREATGKGRDTLLQRALRKRGVRLLVLEMPSSKGWRDSDIQEIPLV